MIDVPVEAFFFIAVAILALGLASLGTILLGMGPVMALRENEVLEGTVERYPYLAQVTTNEDLDAKIWHWCCENFGIKTFGHENETSNPGYRWTYQDVAMGRLPDDIIITVVWMFASVEDATLFELTWC